MRPLFRVQLLKSSFRNQKATYFSLKFRKIVNIWSWFHVIIFIMLQMTAFWKKESKEQVFSWQIRPFLENCHKPPDFDKVLWPNHFSYRHYRGKTISISFIWHLVFWNLPGGTPVMTSWKKWPHLGISDIKKFFPIFTKIFSTSGKIFQPQLFWHQNISTCPSFFCYDEIIFQITNFWIKRLLIQPKLFRHSTWIGLMSDVRPSKRSVWQAF